MSLDTQMTVIVMFVTVSRTESYLPSQSIKPKFYREIFKVLLHYQQKYNSEYINSER